MRKGLLLVSFIAVFMKTPAQNSCTIIYESSYFTTLDSLNEPILSTIIDNQYDILVINDSVSYFWVSHIPGLDESMRLPLGKDFLWHSIYTNARSRISVSQLEPRGQSRYRIKDAWTEIKWELKEETKKIKDHLCYKASYFDGTDSVIAWYTKDLPAGFGPAAFRDLPGTILELTYYWPDHMSRLSAIKITTETALIVEPEKGKLITRELFLQRQNKGQKLSEARLLWMN
jgi:GLPGLI family protein